MQTTDNLVEIRDLAITFAHSVEVVNGLALDIPAGKKEVLIPIDARLPITKATLFAITVEKPGGVVVSDRKRLPLLAPVPKPEDAAQDPPAAESNEQ